MSITRQTKTPLGIKTFLKMMISFKLNRHRIPKTQTLEQ